MAAQELIEQVATAIKDKNEEAGIVAGLALLESVLTTQERIAAALEDIVNIANRRL